MAFIPIDAKADIKGSKKGKLTPAQHAQLNAWCLTNKTGILDCLGKCEYDEARTSLIPTNNKVTIYFKKGYIVICGRLVECEEGSTFELNTPVTGTQEGYIVARYNLSASQESEFVIAQKLKSEGLEKQDLNTYTLGKHELVLYEYKYDETSAKVTLKRETEYVPNFENKFKNFEASLKGEGKPLYEYRDSEGTIEERLTKLGFKEGSVTLSSGTATVNKVTRQGNYVVGNLKFSNFMQNISGTSGSLVLGTLPENFRPKTEQKVGVMFAKPTTTYISYGKPECATISTDGKITVYWWRENTQANAYQIIIDGLNFGFEALPIL